MKRYVSSAKTAEYPSFYVGPEIQFKVVAATLAKNDLNGNPIDAYNVPTINTIFTGFSDFLDALKAYSATYRYDLDVFARTKKSDWKISDDGLYCVQIVDKEYLESDADEEWILGIRIQVKKFADADGSDLSAMGFRI